ncbi:hypothetical protein Tco_0398508 [Tanacetum coccineum]
MSLSLSLSLDLSLKPKSYALFDATDLFVAAIHGSNVNERNNIRLKDKMAEMTAFNNTLYLAFGRHLEEIHVTWAHLEKKQTRLRTYTNISQDYVLRGWRRRHKIHVTPSQFIP